MSDCVNEDCIEFQWTMLVFYQDSISGKDKLELEKAEETEIKLPTSAGSSKKQESFRKTSISALLTVPKPLCGSQLTVESSERDGNPKPPDLSLEKSVCRSGSNS